MPQGDWIEHDGKAPPKLPRTTMVEIKLRVGFPGMMGNDFGPISEWEWDHDPDDAGQDIVAYRVVPHE